MALCLPGRVGRFLEPSPSRLGVLGVNNSSTHWRNYVPCCAGIGFWSVEMMRPLGMIGLALLVLQGCAESPWTKVQEMVAEPRPADPPNKAATPAAAAESPPTPPRKPQETAALPEGPTAPSEVRTSPDVDSLLGLDFVAVRELLGGASLEEIQAPATVWTYSGRGCVLSIFFYPHVDGGEFRALTYDVRSAEKAPRMSQDCFDELLQEREKTEVN